MLLAPAEGAVVDAETAVPRAELARAVGPSAAVQPVGKAMALQDPYGVRREETGPGPGLDVGTGGAFEDDAVDPGGHQEVAEHQAGRTGAENDHIS